MAKRIGFWLGLALFAALLVLPAPAGLSLTAWRVAAVLVLMAAWWMTEALPLTATALLPFLIFPLIGAGTAAEVAGDYYSPVLFLVLGGAFIALAIERCGLHRRIALAILNRAGASPKGLLFAFMAATALVSMFVSNTATTVIMIPMAVALVRAMSSDPQDESYRPLGAALVLGVAYAASLGGLGTLVGSPTNAIAAGLIERSTGFVLDYVTWLAFGLPLVAISVPVAWWLLGGTFGLAGRKLDRAAVLAAIGAPGALTTPERRLLPLLVATVAAWILLPFIGPALGLPKIDDGMIAVAAGLLLFLVPDGRGSTLLTWPETKGAPWDVILMFGGGLALAEGITGSGLALWIGQQLEAVATLPVWAVALLLTGIVILVTEFASNVATASGFIPVIAGVTVATGIDPALLALPAACAASWGFMLPAGTGPNALAFATGYPTMGHFLRAGFWLDVVGVPLIVAVCFTVAAIA
jgi:solute carrier family 13 (sodium-dependent dicarboxylate transporter), member 2/3/5